MRLIEKAEEASAKPRRPWARMKESASALAMLSIAGCAHLSPESADARPLPPGPVSVYSLETTAEPERVVVGDMIEVLLRPKVVIRDGPKGIDDYEARRRGVDLTYCWFVYQEAGYAQDERPVLFLLNPRYQEHGQPRYIGALLDFGADGMGNPIQAVVPVAPDQSEPDLPLDTFWEFGGPPQRRQDALFFVYPDTVVPVMDRMLAGKLGEYCKETASPEYHVTEFGSTRAALAIYPERRENE